MKTNEHRLRAAHARWSASRGTDTACWMELAADDIEFAIAPEIKQVLPQAHFASSREAFRAFLEFWSRDTEMVEFEIDTYLTDADLVIARGHSAWRFRATGRIFRTPRVSLAWFRTGLIRRYEILVDTAAVREASRPTQRLRA